MLNIPSQQPLTTKLEHYLWNCVIKPEVQASLQMCPDGLHVGFSVAESDPYTTVFEQGSTMPMVCQDSSVELFLAFADCAYDVNFAPRLEHCLYLNIELNSRGVCYAKYGRSRKNRTAFSQEEIAALKINPSKTDSSWMINLVVPREFITKLAGYDAFALDSPFALNLYKISETKAYEHYLAFNKVEVEKPNFHLPEYFALCKASA